MSKKKWTHYPESVKLEVLSYYYSHGEQYSKAASKFNMPKDTIKSWVQKYAIEKNCVSLQSEIEKKLGMDNQKEASLEDAQKKISELEKALEYERMRSRAFEIMIEIAEKEEGIEILKKDGAKQ